LKNKSTVFIPLVLFPASCISAPGRKRWRLVYAACWAPVIRIGGADVANPFSRLLEPLVLPDAQRLARDAAAMVRG